MKRIDTVKVELAGTTVGELVATRQGIYFAYTPEWIATGFNLSPLNMEFTTRPHLAADRSLFNGLPGAFADSLPDGWGLLLMDRFFASHGINRADISPLERLAYMADRSMGALEYRPVIERPSDLKHIDIAQLFAQAQDVYEGDTSSTLDALRLAGGSPGGARPKVVVALSQDGSQCSTSFSQLPAGYEHWLVKFRAPDEHRDTGAIEYAYALMAQRAGVSMAPARLIKVQARGQTERFFSARRFDRQAPGKVHMMTASGILYADYRAPSLDYTDLLRATNAITRSAQDVERMARNMVFNALAHNRDDHAKNFAFVHREDRWHLSPAYDLTFCSVRAYRDEHSTSIAGNGLPTRKNLRRACEGFSFLKTDQLIEQTLDALSCWPDLCRDLDIEKAEARRIQQGLDQIRVGLA